VVGLVSNFRYSLRAPETGEIAVTETESRPRNRALVASFLFTDLANPTSNHIYQTIGYVPVVDVDQYHFPAQAAAE